MDWLLIGELDVQRVGCNSIAQPPSFTSPGIPFPQSSNSHDHSSTEHVGGPEFEGLMAAVEDANFTDNEPYYFQVSGHGSESGLRDGFLNQAEGYEFDGENTVIPRYSFSPRDCPGLGKPGDSGTWIFVENGKLLGQIHSYN